ncbi:AbrB/MazE/SpoVT family DNA-binding domain-containing protein [Candidatus Desulforudis audaxviator]|uniref:AbrB/MazE/SpoVT family DNA-binding domain-containing protein n=1 Tax=Candidatus Desulforudis audaxviator TaxID=471827 RepID=UPI00140F64E5
METHISSKGQVTLPAPVRKKLGLRTGDVLKVICRRRQGNFKSQNGEPPRSNNSIRYSA